MTTSGHPIHHSKVLMKKYRYCLMENIPLFETRYYAQKFIDDLLPGDSAYLVIEKNLNDYQISWRLPFRLVLDRE